MDLKVVVLVALALGMGFVASETEFNNKIPKIQNVIDSSSSIKNPCPDNLTTYLDNNIDSMKVTTDLKTSDYNLNVRGLNNWRASNVYEFSCRGAFDEGENVNYRYCTEHTVGDLEYEKIDSDGNIVDQKSVRVEEFVLDGDGNVVNVTCEEL